MGLHVSKSAGRASQPGLSRKPFPVLDGVWANRDLWSLVQHVRSVRTRKKLNKPKINTSSYIHQRNEVTGQTTVPKIEETSGENDNCTTDRGQGAENSAGTSTWVGKPKVLLTNS